MNLHSFSGGILYRNASGSPAAFSKTMSILEKYFYMKETPDN